MSEHELKLNAQEKEKSNTIKDLLKGKSTIEQLDILTRADMVFKDRAGRYYGGTITDEEANLIYPPKLKKPKKNE